MADLVILVGFRGVGKTTIGKMLSKALGYEFLDTDAEIVRQRGEDISDIVAKEGWSAFRRYEKAVIASLTTLSRTVVSTGGGAVLHEDIWLMFQDRAIIIWLSADEKVIQERLVEDTLTSAQRPALDGRDSLSEVADILKLRRPLYQQVAHHMIDTGKLGIGEAVQEICQLMDKNAF